MAVKNQSKSKKKARRRLKLQEQAARAEPLERIKRNELLTEREIVKNPPEQARMSDVCLISGR
jgi:hypothetical protein